MKTILLLVFLSSMVVAQRSVTDLAPTHAAELKRYLSANKDLTFRLEDNLSDDYLKSMRETFGKSFTPNYSAGDFNRDKVKDFAVLVYRAGAPNPNEGITSGEHAVDHPLKLVVFNGTRAGFRVAFTKDLEGPPASFIMFDKKLYYGIFETDSDTFSLVPTRRGYAIQFEGL